MQAPDMVWNRTFKDRIQGQHDNWLANAKHEYTAAGNIKPIPMGLVVEWIIKWWEEISTEMVAHSMKSCALALAIGGIEDGLISCFKKVKMLGKQSVIGKSKAVFQWRWTS